MGAFNIYHNEFPLTYQFDLNRMIVLILKLEQHKYLPDNKVCIENESP